MRSKRGCGPKRVIDGMAEAGVNLRPPTAFFCYTCNARFRRPHQEDYTCPTCGGGFVEEIPEQEPQPMAHVHDTGAALVSSILGGEQGPGGSPSPAQFIEMLFGPFAGGSRSIPNPGPQGNPNFRPTATGISFTLTPSNRGGNQQDNEADNPADQLFQSFLSNLIVGLGGQAQGPNLFGNLGDYVWGRDGLDTIVTQLMNQFDGSGPPPLDADKLERLQTKKIQPEQVAAKLECSVCWDEFKLDEEVKQLDCDHVYHPACIIPWLKLHGTCPVCRRDFTESGNESKDPGGQSSTASININPSTFPLNLLQRPSSTGRSPSASAVSSSTSSSVPPAGRSDDTEADPSSSSNPNRSMGMDMDMEFD